MIKLLIYVVVAFLISTESTFSIYAFTTASSSSRVISPSIIRTTLQRNKRTDRSLLLFANKNDDDDDNNKENNNNWISARLERADFSEIRRDVILCTCFVLGRYFIYDVTTGAKLVPGFVFDTQDAIWLTGTLSSAALLGIYWTAAGLLTRLFETRGSVQANAVNIAMAVPIWISTEHFLHFGPPNIGGSTLDASVANAFLGLAIFMAVTKTITSDWR